MKNIGRLVSEIQRLSEDARCLLQTSEQCRNAMPQLEEDNLETVPQEIKDGIRAIEIGARILVGQSAQLTLKVLKVAE